MMKRVEIKRLGIFYIPKKARDPVKLKNDCITTKIMEKLSVLLQLKKRARRPSNFLNISCLITNHLCIIWRNPLLE